MRRARRWWWGFGLFVLVLLAGLVTISRVTLDLEERNRLVEAEASQREQLRDALWTLDGWFGQILDDEADRAASDSWFAPLPGQALASPLLSDAGAEGARPLFAFRFEALPSGALELRPTAPSENPYAPGPERIAETRAWIDDNDLSEVVELAEMATCSNLALPQQAQQAQQIGQFEQGPVQNGAVVPQRAGQQWVQTDGDYGAPVQTLDIRSQASRNSIALKARSQRKLNEEASLLNGVPAVIGEAGVLLPTWRTGDAGLELLLLRRVFSNDGVRIQGLSADWSTLERELLTLSEPILPGLSLEPLVDGATTDIRWVGSSLASIPVGLVAPQVELPPVDGLSPAGVTLGMAWLAALLSIAVAFASLRSSVAFGERRSRFASAVTHELRTPLTTFQLYSEMLADGMVEDPEQRRQYLDTLRTESERLSGLVESVLAYSRLEEKRGERRRQRRLESTTVGALVERHRPRWESALERAGLTLAVDLDAADAPLHTDGEAVGQIISNLVENAAKYAADGDPQRVEITAERHGGPVEISVRDHGPGVDPGAARRIFEPFDRAGRESGTLPGAGLGLSIARALARDLGGDLRLDTAVSPGARFVLRLPVAPK